MMDRKANEARKTLIDWDKRRARGSKGYDEGRDWFSKHGREAEKERRNSSQGGGIAELLPLSLPIHSKWA